jgi:hypothetical protein
VSAYAIPVVISPAPVPPDEVVLVANGDLRGCCPVQTDIGGESMDERFRGRRNCSLKRTWGTDAY